jgi:hypothetical protein
VSQAQFVEGQTIETHGSGAFAYRPEFLLGLWRRPAGEFAPRSQTGWVGATNQAPAARSEAGGQRVRPPPSRARPESMRRIALCRRRVVPAPRARPLLAGREAIRRGLTRLLSWAVAVWPSPGQGGLAQPEVYSGQA